MKRAAMCAEFLMLAAALAICANGCSEKTGGPADEKSPYRDLTEKEDCVTNLMVSHILKEFDRYAELLHQDYIWYGAKWGLYSDPLGSLDRAEDIDLTTWIFQNTVSIELDITESEWLPVEKIEGRPCTDCWETQRVYTFMAQDTQGGAVTSSGRYIRVVVTPVDADGTTEYRIRTIYHLDEG